MVHKSGSKIYRFLSNHFFLITLLLITIVVALANFIPNQWLSGWDTLHPEFNFKLNLERMLFGAWREDQGLGAVAAHAHMSDLPRILILWLLQVFLPLNSVKFIYVLIALVLGPAGIYFFIKELLSEGVKTKDLIIAKAASFLGGLVYLFNLGTVQHFYVVFEMFAVQYAAIGWLFYLALKYLKNRNIKTLLVFFVVTFLATPMAYASLLWFAYFAGFGLFLLSYLIKSKDKKKIFISSVYLTVITLVSNLFWLLPNLYLLFSGASEIPKNSHINSIFSEEAFLHNQAYGSLKDVAILKNFLFSWNNFDFSNQEYVKLLNVWQDHLNQPGILAIGYFVAALVVLGIIAALFKRNKNILALVPSFLLGLVMLINANGVLEAPFLWLRENNGLFNEALRFPFTKFSILLMMTASVFVAYILYELLLLLSKKKIIYSYALVSIFTISLIWYSYPMFKGELIGGLMTNRIPEEYFEFYDWAESKPKNARIAAMPLYSYAGWEYHNWGYEGPGFNWFDLKQPLLVRDFDRWNPNNETFYNQISTALYKDDIKGFKNSLSKYDVFYVLIDESVILPIQENELLRFPSTKKMLLDMGAELVWNKNKLSIYDVSKNSQLSNDSFVSSVSTAVISDYDNTYSRLDPLYSNNGNYVSDSRNEGVKYPFSGLGKTKINNLNYDESDSDFIKISYVSNIDDGLSHKLSLPKFENDKVYSLPVVIEKNDSDIKLSILFPYQIYSDSRALIDNSNFERTLTLDNDYEEVSVSFGGTTFELNDEKLKQTGIITLFPNDDNKVILYGANPSLGNQAVIPVLLTESDSIGSELMSYLNQVISINSRKIVSADQISAEVLSKKKKISIENSGFDLNCELFKEGAVEKEVVDNEVIYSANDKAALCDSVLISKLKTSYLIKLAGEGLKGGGLKYSIRSWVGAKPELEELLPKGKFEESYGVLHNSDEEVGFSLNLETRSFSNKLSQNSTDDLSYYLYPIETIAEISLSTETDGNIFLEGTTVKKVDTIGNSFYSVITSSDSDNEFIYLSQSYDDGWQAYSLNSSIRKGSLTHKVAKVAPWFFGTKLEHHRFNSWANMWLVPQGDNIVVVLYWPQLLSLTGYSLLVVTVVIFGIFFTKRLIKNRFFKV